MAKSLTLKRSLSFPLVCLYGLGNILGAGVYVLIGKVAGGGWLLHAVLLSNGLGNRRHNGLLLRRTYLSLPLSAGEAV